MKAGNRFLRSRFGLVAVCAGLLVLGTNQIGAASAKNFAEKIREAVRLELRRDGGDLELLLVDRKPALAGLGLPRLPFWYNTGELPVQVTIREIGATYVAGVPTKNHLRFDVEIRFTELLPTLRAENLVLHCDGKLDLGKTGKLSYRHPENIPFPIGTSGLALYGYEISFYPGENRVSIETDLATYPGDPRLLKLRGKIGLTLPLKKMEFAGKLMASEVALATVSDAEITSELVKGTLHLPGDTNLLLLDWLYQGRGQFQLDRYGLTATGDFSVLRTLHKRMEWAIGWDGTSVLQTRDRFQFLGLKSQLSLSMQFEPGFGKSWLKAKLNGS